MTDDLSINRTHNQEFTKKKTNEYQGAKLFSHLSEA